MQRWEKEPQDVPACTPNVTSVTNFLVQDTIAYRLSSRKERVRIRSKLLPHLEICYVIVTVIVFEFTLLFGMLRKVPLNLRRSLRNLHTHASYHKRSCFTVEKALATAVVAGSILWYSTNKRIHNDALPFSEKQQKLSSPSLAKLAEHGALTTVVWGSNRHAYYSRYSGSFF